MRVQIGVGLFYQHLPHSLSAQGAWDFGVQQVVHVIANFVVHVRDVPAPIKHKPLQLALIGKGVFDCDPHEVLGED